MCSHYINLLYEIRIREAVILLKNNSIHTNILLLFCIYIYVCS